MNSINVYSKLEVKYCVTNSNLVNYRGKRLLVNQDIF